jgi:mono/diheme cytochrome c family protein
MMVARFLPLTLLCCLHAADKPPRTVWDGVYTAAQADRGMSAYEYSCSRCHGENLTASGNVLRGAKFLDHWREDSLKSFFTVLKATMPRGAPQSLGDGDYVDIVAYVLRANEFPSGPEELTTATLNQILVVGKDGPKPVPDFALVRTAGCLAQTASGTWVLKNAAEPARTRAPREPLESEVAESAALKAGAHTFRLLDVLNFESKLHEGQWMEARGFLIRTAEDERINLTWLESLKSSSDRSCSLARP